jgi:hypothetical protein
MFQPQLIERRRTEQARVGTRSPGRGRGSRIRAVATVALLAVAVGVLTGFVAFRVTRDAPDRGLAADTARWQAQADASHARERLQQAIERGRAADAARWQAQADASVRSNGSRWRSVALMAGGAPARKPNQQLGADPARPADASPAQRMLMRVLARERNTYPAPLDQAGQAAELALTGTLAREQPSPADDARQPAQTGQVDQRRILSTLGVIATTVVVAMTWRRRVRPHLRQRA